MSINIYVPKYDAPNPPDLYAIRDRFKFGMGVLNNSYVLETENISLDDFVVMYDEKMMGRGFEIKDSEKQYEMTLPLPCSETDIAIFYDTAEWLCRQLGNEYFYQDEDKVYLKYIGYCKDGAMDISLNQIFDICDSIALDEMKNYTLFCCRNPIVLGKDNIREIDSLEAFGAMMNRLQKWDAFYPSLRFYSAPDEKPFRTIFVGDEIPTIIPTQKIVPWNIDFEVEEWYMLLPGGSAIKFDDFIERVEELEKYDTNHIIICLDEEQIAEMELRLNYSIQGKEYSPLVYWGRQIDSGHDYKIEEKHLPLDKLCGYNHLAVYLRYRAENDLLALEFVRKIGADNFAYIRRNQIDVRNFIANDEFVGGELCSRYFVPEFSLFTRRFYTFGNDKGFPAKVDDMALAYFGEEKYNCKEFDDEAYLFVPYDDEYYNALSAVIDSAWKKFKRARK